MSRCIVSRVAGDHYRRLQRRTYNRCQCFCQDARLQFDAIDTWSYDQKLVAIETALNQHPGARYVLWMDVSFEPVASLEPIWGLIEQDGWFIARQGDSTLRNWVSDDALYEYGKTRDELANVPLCMSGLVGLDLKSDIGCMIFKGWKRLAHTFVGHHRNIPGGDWEIWGNKTAGHVSFDETVGGHRHDESALSFVMWSLGLEIRNSGLIAQDVTEGYIVGRNMQRMDGTYAD